MPPLRPRGMNDQRDRGRRKKDHKSDQPRHQNRNQNAWDEFELWLCEQFRDSSGNPIQPNESFNLKRFLQNTIQVELSSDEKLRQLAIHWEYKCTLMEQPKGWLILKRIYEEAIRFDPSWHLNYHSLSLSARECAESVEPDSDSWNTLLNDATDACMRGLAIDSSSSLLHLSMGRIHYEKSKFQEAIESFDAALSLDPTQMWAALFRAHSFHDLEAWQKAVSAYQSIDRSFFNGPKSWRAVLIRDQIADCLYHAGRHQESRESFLASIKQYEANRGLLFITRYLELACRYFPEDCSQRTIALFEREGFYTEAEEIKLATSR